MTCRFTNAFQQSPQQQTHVSSRQDLVPEGSFSGVLECHAFQGRKWPSCISSATCHGNQFGAQASFNVGLTMCWIKVWYIPCRWHDFRHWPSGCIHRHSGQDPCERVVARIIQDDHCRACPNCLPYVHTIDDAEHSQEDDENKYDAELDADGNGSMMHLVCIAQLLTSLSADNFEGLIPARYDKCSP